MVHVNVPLVSMLYRVIKRRKRFIFHTVWGHCLKIKLILDVLSCTELVDLQADRQTDHLEMLSSQHLASALRPTHPSHAVVTAPHGPRSMKETLGHKCEASVAPYLSNGVIDPAEYRSTITKIHTDSISGSIKKLEIDLRS